MSKRDADRLRQAADDLTHIADNWATYRRKLAEYEAKGWPDTTNNETGRNPVGEHPRGLSPQPDPIAQRRRAHDIELGRVITWARTARAHLEWIINPSNPDLRRHGRTEHCRNPWCGDVIRTPDGDLPNTDRCPPCHRWRTEHGSDAPARVIAERLRKRAERQKETPT